MNLRCWLIRRTLEQSVAQGLPHELHRFPHLRSCAACREYGARLASLAVSLTALANPQSPGPGFEEEVWARLDRAEATGGPSRFRPRVLAAACSAAALACIWLYRETVVQDAGPSAISERVAMDLRNSRSRKGATTETGAEVARAGSAERGSGSSSTRRVVNASAVGSADHKYAKPRLAANRMARREGSPSSRAARRTVSSRQRGHLASMPVKQRPTQVVRADSKVNAATSPQTAWATWGAWYEQQGDFDRAAAAYEQAQMAAGEAVPAALLYRAGHAAECAGDVSAAVDAYSKMLSRSSGAGSDPKDEKGIQLWIPSGDTA